MYNHVSENYFNHNNKEYLYEGTFNYSDIDCDGVHDLNCSEIKIFERIKGEWTEIKETEELVKIIELKVAQELSKEYQLEV